jgi:hypothetical protein
MKLIDMKQSKEEVKESLPTTSKEEAKAQYPYGLRITLDKDSLKKLDMDAMDFSLDDEISITCVGEVVRVSKSDDQYGKSENVEIQIMKLNLAEYKWDKDFKKASEGK